MQGQSYYASPEQSPSGEFHRQTVLDLVNQGLMNVRWCFVSTLSQNPNIPEQKERAKMSVVNPETASVTTTRDSSLKIRLNQITKQTAKMINSDSLSLVFHQMDIKSADCKIPSNDFLFCSAVLIFWLHFWREALSALSELCPSVLPRGL